jgi:hypothetical protein
MTILAQAFLPLVRRHFMPLSLLAAGHEVLLGNGEMNE